MKQRLQQKTALITGASRGLGAAIAQRFWMEGANLVLVARDQHALKQLSNSFTVSNEQTVKLISADLSDKSTIETITQNKNIDILINNAAIQGPIGPIWENDWNEWEKTLQINLLSPIALCRAYASIMQSRDAGKIINLSGGGATQARPGFSAYAVSKTGLVRFSENLAEELKHTNVSVNCIAPGMMNTDMLKEIFNAGIDKIGEKEHSVISKKMLVADDKTMESAVELCVYLTSAQSDGISGKLISAIWDPWKEFTNYADELRDSDVYTLRRIVPKDRGKTWGDVA